MTEEHMTTAPDGTLERCGLGPDLKSEAGHLIAHSVVEVDNIIAGYRVSTVTAALAMIFLTTFVLTQAWWTLIVAAVMMTIDVFLRMGIHHALQAYLTFATVATVHAEKGLTDEAK